ncbi:MAG: helix-turn-helix domain-containing protein [Spirochaetes bacterium]|nr:helix-turn-helix domain-containing protein [Spirochaetota bacterium]
MSISSIEPQARRTLSINEAAARYGFSKHTFYKMVSARRIPFLRIGPKIIRFDADALDRFFFEESAVRPIARAK